MLYTEIAKRLSELRQAAHRNDVERFRSLENKLLSDFLVEVADQRAGEHLHTKAGEIMDGIHNAAEFFPQTEDR